MIPDRTLKEIQERLDIVEVIGAAIPLKKAGRNFKALCPFHPEKTPSFMVYPQKQFFICYGCGAGGDLITFAMRHEHLDFPEAVQALAQKAGVAVEQVAAGAGTSVAPELYRANEVAARFYREGLQSPDEGEPARAYLKGRGLKPESWETFQLGYAPSRWDGLLNRAREENLTPQILERAGLAIPREEGAGWYDRFRNRVIFPISDSRGRVIGFGGRVLEDREGPKYMNSPETELYVKGRILYGLHLAAPHIREKDFCIVVEGYMDLCSPFQYGIRNVVASMGTSLTPEQVRLIRRYTRHVVMVYDGDYAGQMATLRGLDLFLEAEMRVKVAGLPGGLDPDSLIKTQGIEALVRAIQDSKDLFDYKLGILRERFDPGDLQGRVQICQEMLPTVKRVPNPIARGEYVKRLGEALGIGEELLWIELKRVKGEGSWKPSVLSDPSPKAAMTAEDLLAGLLLEEPSRIAFVEGRLQIEELQDPQVRRLVELLLQEQKKGTVPSDHRPLVNPLARQEGGWEGRMARWLAWADSILEKEQVLEEVLGRIRANRRRALLENLKDSIRHAEEAGDETATAQLILEYNRCLKAQVAR